MDQNKYEYKYKDDFVKGLEAISESLSSITGTTNNLASSAGKMSKVPDAIIGYMKAIHAHKNPELLAVGDHYIVRIERSGTVEMKCFECDTKLNGERETEKVMYGYFVHTDCTDASTDT